MTNAAGRPPGQRFAPGPATPAFAAASAGVDSGLPPRRSGRGGRPVPHRRARTGFAGVLVGRATRKEAGSLTARARDRVRHRHVVGRSDVRSSLGVTGRTLQRRASEPCDGRVVSCRQSCHAMHATSHAQRSSCSFTFDTGEDERKATSISSRHGKVNVRADVDRGG